MVVRTLTDTIHSQHVLVHISTLAPDPTIFLKTMHTPICTTKRQFEIEIDNHLLRITKGIYIQYKYNVYRNNYSAGVKPHNLIPNQITSPV